MNPAQGSVAPSTAVRLCGWFPCVRTRAAAESSSACVRAHAYELSAICVKAGFISQADKVSKQLPRTFLSDILADTCSSLLPSPDVPERQAQGTGTDHSGESQAPAAATGLRVKAYYRDTLHVIIVLC